MSVTVIPGLTLGGEPRAQLLPVSVKLREKARGARRLMVLLVVLAVVVAAGGTAWAFTMQAAAKQELAAANARTAQILEAQSEFAEASRLSDLVANTHEAQLLVTSTEIQWLPLLVELIGYVPAEGAMSGVSFTAPAPWEPAAIPEGPLRTPRVAVVTIELASSNYLTAAKFVETIPSIYGFADVKIDNTELKEGVYVTTITLTLNAEAVSERFVEATETTDDAATDEEATTEEEATTDEGGEDS